MARLYDLVGDMDTLYCLMQDESYCDEDGIVNPDFIEMFGDTQKDIKAKALNAAKVVKQLKADSTMLETERKNLQARENRLKKNAEWLEEYLSNCLQTAKIDSLSDTQAEIKFRKSQAVEIDTMFDLSQDDFVRIIPEERKPDKAKIKEALKRGECVIGAYIEDRLNIQIK